MGKVMHKWQARKNGIIRLEEPTDRANRFNCMRLLMRLRLVNLDG